MLLSISIFFIIFIFSCSQSIQEKNGHHHKSKNYGLDSVNITDKITYYEVEINYTTGATPFQIGEQYGIKIKKMIPDMEGIIDSYISDSINYLISLMPFPVMADTLYRIMILRTSLFMNMGQIPVDYLNEISGLSKTLCSTSKDILGDGKLSANELYMVNFILDIAKATQCSAVSVFGGDSTTTNTITGRILDWYGGENKQIAKIQAVVKFVNNNKSIISIGYLGLMAGLTIINNDKIFAAILESSTGNPYPTDLMGVHSYSMDLRYAMENYTTLDDVANYLQSQPYVAGHLIFLSDPAISKVLENDLSGTRALRISTSNLNAGITWGHDFSIASVNAFMLNGNFNNYTTASNTNRWKSITDNLSIPAGPDDIKNLMSYNGVDGKPGDITDGDIYNSSSQMIIVFQPDNLDLEIFFRPRSGVLLDYPVFQSVSISF